jgi:hypothetical protein
MQGQRITYVQRLDDLEANIHSLSERLQDASGSELFELSDAVADLRDELRDCKRLIKEVDE